MGAVLTSTGHHLPRGVCQKASASTSSCMEEEKDRALSMLL